MPFELQAPVIFRTPAKVTFRLEVLSRRPDGYHDVRIAQAPVSLYDALELHPLPGGEIMLETHSPWPLGPEGENLAVRAARAFFAQAAGPGAPAPGLRIVLRKAIPPGGGMGGGSGNAGGMLHVLNALAGSPLDEAALGAMALKLGADVPFFLQPAPGWALGVGERLAPLGAHAPVPLVLLTPPVHIATAEAYRHVHPGDARTAEDQIALKEPSFATLDDVRGALFNAFEAALLPRVPELGQARAALLEAGALAAQLSGSGATVFGLFGSPGASQAAATALKDNPALRGWFVHACASLSGHAYL